MKHIAHTMSFDDLWNGLQTAKAEGFVREQVSDGLHLFVYSEKTVYERQWTPITMAARGLILDPADKRIVATPFEKFFNYGERADQPTPDLPFETMETLDGSLAIIFHHRGQWRTATKGSLQSDQAKWAAQWMAAHNTSLLDKETTYLAEAIYPANRVVVHYPRDGLFLLGAYRSDGTELTYDEIVEVGNAIGWPVAKRFHYNSVSDLLALADTLPASEEGWVLRFENGLRLKVKGAEYRRIHSLVSRLTPLAMWEAMMAGDDLETIRKQLPEEFWTDFDAITTILQDHLSMLLATVRGQAELVKHLSDKDLGLRLDTFPPDVRPFIFPYRKQDGELLTGRTRQTLFRTFRPTGNILPGYTASYAVNRVFAECG